MVQPPAPPHSGGASASNPTSPKRLVARAKHATRSGLAVAFPCRTDDRESPANDRRPLTTSNGCGGRVDSTRISDTRFRIEPTFSRHGFATQGSERSPWRLLLWVIALVLGLVTSLPAQSAAPRVALVLDQDAPSLEPQVAAFKREIQGFFRPGEITLLPPRAGDGTAAGREPGAGPRAQRQQRRGGRGAGPDRLAPAGPRGRAEEAGDRGDDRGRGLAGHPQEGRRQRRPQPGLRGRVVCPERNGRRLPPDDPVPPDGGPARPRAAGGDSRARGQRPLSRPRRRRRRGGHPGAGHGRSDPGRAAGRRRRRLPHPDPGAWRGRDGAPDRGAERAATAHAEPHRRRRARGRPGVLRAARALAPPRPPGGGGPPAHPGRRGRRHAAGATGRRPAAHPQPRHRPDDRVLARLQRPDRRGAGRHRLARPGRHRLAGGGDARRGGGQPRPQGRGPRGGIGRAGRATRPLQPAPPGREPVRRNGDPGGDRGREPGPAAPAAARRRALLLGAALLRAGLGRLRLGAAPAAGPGSRAGADPARRRARRGPGLHQRASGPHPGRRAALEPVPQPHQPRDGAGPRETWGAPAGPTSTAGRARWPTRGAT